MNNIDFTASLLLGTGLGPINRRASLI